MTQTLTVLRHAYRLTKTVRAGWQVENPEPKNFTYRLAAVHTSSDLLSFVTAQLSEPREAIVLGKPSEDWLPGEAGLRRSRDSEDAAATLLEQPVGILPIDIDTFETANWHSPAVAADEIRRALEIPEAEIIWAVTASYGKKPGVARLRLWINLAETVSLYSIKEWARSYPWVDQSLYDPAHLIYTARPIFEGERDPLAGVQPLAGILRGLPIALPVAKDEPVDLLHAEADMRLLTLKENGLYGHKLQQGRHAITCPWSDEHTSNIEGVDSSTAYMEAFFGGHKDPAFKCLHAHCANRTILDLDDFLELGKKTPRVNQWYYIYGPRIFVHKGTRELYSVPSYDDRYSCKAMPSSKKYFQDPHAVKFDAMTFMPGRPVVIERSDGHKMLNVWINRRIEPIDGDVSPWTDHLHTLIPGEEECTLFMQWMAWVYTRIGERVHWAPVFIGPQGNGKTTVCNVLAAAIGEEHTARPTTTDIKGQFNTWAFRKELVIVEELMTKESLELANHLKPIITNPRISVRMMRTDPFDSENTCSMMCCSNFMNAISVDTDDRRYMFVNASARHEPARLNELHRWLQEERGVAKVAGWMKGVNLASFPVRGPAPHTRLRDVAVEATRPVLSEATDVLRVEYASRTLVTSLEIEELLSRSGINVQHRRFGLMASSLGWQACGRGRIGQRFATCWSTRDHEKWSKVDWSVLIRLAQKMNDSSAILG